MSTTTKMDKQMLNKLFISLFLGLLLSGGASAQSICPSIITGAVLTAGQWNVCFSNKQDVLGYSPLNLNGGVMTGPLDTVASTAGQAGLNIGVGVTVTAPNNGDIWATNTGFNVQINGSTQNTVVASSAPSNQFATGVSVGGIIAYAQPSFSNISGTISAGQFATAPGIVTLAMLNNAAASTLVGNTTTGSAVRTDFTIDGLTLKASPASTDEVILWDVSGTALKKATVSGIGTSSGVSSLGGLTGAITVGTGVACSGSSCTGTTVGGLSGAVTFDKGLACSGSECKQSLANVSLQASPSLPGANSSTTGIMAGFGSSCAMTPAYSTRLFVSFQGSVFGNTTNIATLNFRYGTGTAPVAGAAATGTSVGGSVSVQTVAATSQNIPFTLNAIITGLSAGTAYWFDIDGLVNTGNVSYVASSVSCSGSEF